MELTLHMRSAPPTLTHLACRLRTLPNTSHILLPAISMPLPTPRPVYSAVSQTRASCTPECHVMRFKPTGYGLGLEDFLEEGTLVFSLQGWVEF